MADVMNSLFGMTPESIQRQRDNELQARALQFAQLSPQQAAQMAFYTAGSRLGDVGAGLLGAQDPELQKATTLQALLKDVDPNSAEGLSTLARTLAQQGFGKEADRAAQQALAMREKESVITKNMRERAAADPFQQFLRSAVGKVTPESLAKYQQTGNPSDLDWTEKPEKSKSYGADAERISKALFGSEYDKLTPQQAATVNQKLLEQELTVKATGAPKISVSTQQETAFAKQRGELQAKSLSEAETQAKASANAVNRLANMEKLNRGDLLTGPLAGSAIGAGQFLSSLGLLSPDSAKTLASSEIYDKQAKDLVMQDLGGKLGAQISNADREFIEARIPQLRNSQPARTELIGKLKEIHKKNIDYYQRMSKYATSKGNLNDFDFASGAPDNTESPKSPVATKRFNPTTGKLEVIGGQ